MEPRQQVWKLCRTGAASVLAVLIATSALAQGVSGTISGSVKDAQGLVLPGATVTLISESRGTRSAPAVTSVTGDFVFPNIAADTYTVQIEMPSFKTLKRSGVAVSPGSLVAVGTMTLDVGGASEEVIVKGEPPLVQAASGERSFTVNTDLVANLPIAGRTSNAVLSLVPGVDGTSRIGGGGGNNYQVDGITNMEIGSNRIVTTLAMEAVSEVKVETSSYQAEYGRASGLQVNAVTKSGTNSFKGSLYDVERRSDWNANSQTNILNGDPKTYDKQKDWGYSIGGPIGRPGASNKLFFFYTQEFNPRTQGGVVTRYRVPTALERQGDFSQSLDNNGAVYNLIRDASTGLPCTATNTTGCFRDGGVVGRIPASRLYQPGMNILNWYPAANVAMPAGQAYNYQNTSDNFSLTGWQPLVKLDYQVSPSLRASYKFFEYQQTRKTVPGTIPGFNDTRLDNPATYVNSATVNWTITPTTFAEVTWGRTTHHQEGCTVAGGEPNFCQSAMPMNQSSNRITAGMGAIPYLFPDAPIITAQSAPFTYDVLQKLQAPIWDGTRIQLAPSFAWGTRVTNAPPNVSFPGNFINTLTQNLTAQVTKVMGRHTAKAGVYFYYNESNRSTGNPVGTITFGNDTANPIDSTFGYSNAALGIFSSYAQASKLPEGLWIARNIESFIQDNWKVSSRFTFDYGIRFNVVEPMYDGLGKSSNFLPEQWAASAAPRQYVATCANGVFPCTGTNRQAMDPLTGQSLGANSVLAIGTLVPNTGNLTNGVFLPGQGIVKTQYKWEFVITPRVGFAWDVKGNQMVIIRGGAGLFTDRPTGNAVYNTANNVPNVRNVTVRYGQLQSLGSTGLTTEAPPSLFVNEYDRGPAKSAQWNVGVQMVLPWSTSLDVAYTGQHSYDTLAAVNINSIDFGAAFLDKYQDKTVTAAGVASSVVSLNPDLARYYRGFSTITQQQMRSWETYHSLQLSINRRMRNGIAFGFNDTWTLYDHTNSALRLQHNADGSVVERADQSDADKLLGTAIPTKHLMKANAVWTLPTLKSDQAILKLIGYVVNDWQLSSVWTGRTGAAYSIGYAYQTGGGNVNITGSPDFAGRVRIVGDTDDGCSSDSLRQFTASAFQGPTVGSVGLESGAGYLRGCFLSTFDTAIARNVKMGGKRNLQIRIDLFNVFNSAQVTNRNTTMNLTSPSDPVTITNLPYDATGNPVAARSLPRGAGFGVATAYATPRNVQVQLRFSF